MSDAGFDEAADREWQLREQQEMKEEIKQQLRQRHWEGFGNPTRHFWLHAGVFSVVVHALIVRQFTTGLEVNMAVVALGALVSLVDAVSDGRERGRKRRQDDGSYAS